MGDLGQKVYRSVVSCENKLSQRPADWIYFRSSFSQRHCYDITRDLSCLQIFLLQFKCTTFHIFTWKWRSEWKTFLVSKTVNTCRASGNLSKFVHFPSSYQKICQEIETAARDETTTELTLQAEETQPYLTKCPQFISSSFSLSPVEYRGEYFPIWAL